MNWDAFYQITVMAFAVSAIAVTITKAKVFQPIRGWIKSKSVWLGDLFSCPYCLSHWLAIIIVAIYQPDMFSFFLILDLIIAIFLMIAFSAIVSGIITKLFPFNNEEREIINSNNNAMNNNDSW